MKEKQIFGVLFVIGILIALIGATLMWFGIAPIPLRITIVILGTSLVALSNPIAKSKNI
jgi:hypothetical protein